MLISTAILFVAFTGLFLVWRRPEPPKVFTFYSYQVFSNGYVVRTGYRVRNDHYSLEALRSVEKEVANEEIKESVNFISINQIIP